MKHKYLFAVALLALAGCAGTSVMTSKGEPYWKLGVQNWTFRQLNFADTVQQVSALGVTAIEAYPGQKLGGGMEGNFHHSMNALTRQQVLGKLRDAGVSVVSYGVVGAGSDAEWQQIFEFAVVMGIRTIVSEPDPKQFAMLDTLCTKHGINLAVHNHPKPSRYWNPDTVLEVLKGRSHRMGACVDTGHWVRSGLDPVVCLNKLKGRIIEVHFKDLNRRAAQAYDVPWGTGDSDAVGMLAALREQKFKGYFMVEYEKAGPDLVANVKRCIEYFNNARLLDAVQLDSGAALVPGMARNVSKTWTDVKVTPDNNQWLKPQELSMDDLSNAIYKEGSWVFTNGVLEARGGGDIWTKEQYGDFILEMEFRCETNTNSGVFLRCADIQNWLHTSIEVQILQPDAPDKKHTCGAIFDCLAPSAQAIKPAGKWNHYRITAKGNRITVELNDQKVTDMDLNRWTEAGKNPDGTPNKFNTAYKDMARKGHIGLQYHGNPIAFRNLTVTPLPGK